MRGRVAIFVEDRVFADPAGQVFSNNRRLEGRGWEQLGPRGTDRALCARLAHVDQTDASHRLSGHVWGMPYFQGLKGAVLQLPRLVWHAYRVGRQADLVVAKCPGLVGSSGVLGAKLAGKKIAIHCVGDAEDAISEEDEGRGARLLSWLGKTLQRWTVLQADAIRYSTKGFLQSKYPGSSPDKQFWFTDAAVSAVAEVSDPPTFTPGRILAIGSQERMYKGHHLLIAAMPTVLKHRPDAQLVLVGDGVCREALVEQVAELGLAEHVQFVDFLDGWAEVSAMMRTAHVFAMPSLTEGLPRALLEAMSLGTACIGSDTSGIPELLTPELIVPRGTVEPLAALLIRVLTDDAFRKKAAWECLDHCGDFTQERLELNIRAWEEKLLDLVAVDGRR